MAESKRKPLSFDTTMRNPERIASFLKQVLPYENHILTNDVIMKIEHNIIKNKLYVPVYIDRVPRLKAIKENEDMFFSDADVIEIIKNSPQNHKEAGFDKGWPSRFDTQFNISKEFGFIYYEIGERIQISTIGHMLIDAINEIPVNEKKIQNIFLNSMAKYQIDNPFRKNSNSNVPLILLLKVLKLLKEDKSENQAGIFKQELSLFICWPDDNEIELYNKIKEIRSRVRYSYSDEYMYDICLEILGCITPEEKAQAKSYYKMSKICKESVDEYIRKMRITGIISLRGSGRFLDFNMLEKEKIDYVLNEYSNYKKYTSKKDFFEYMGEIDSKILEIKTDESVDLEKLRQKTLHRLADTYSNAEIMEELLKVSRKRESLNSEFRYITGSVRFELLTSVALLQNFEDIEVHPNYPIDDEGLPTSTALGDIPDILCKQNDYDSNVEVTLMCGRSDQVNNEIIPIRRHLLDLKAKNDKSFAIFVAPFIHEDAIEASEWYKFKDNIDIVTCDTVTFIDKIGKYKKISEFLENDIV